MPDALNAGFITKARIENIRNDINFKEANVNLKELVKKTGAIEILREDQVTIYNNPPKKSYVYYFENFHSIIKGDIRRYIIVGGGNTEEKAKTDYIEKIKGSVIYLNTPGPNNKHEVPEDLTLE